MLARIDDVDGVARSRVSWDGRAFLIELDPGADGKQVSSDVAAMLGHGAARMQRKAEEASVAGHRQGERWLDHEEAVALSRDEARHLAQDYAAAISEEAELDETQAQRLEAALRAELEAAFERAHAKGGGVERLRAELPEARRGFEQRIAELLNPEQCSAVSASLDRMSE